MILNTRYFYLPVYSLSKHKNVCWLDEWYISNEWFFKPLTFFLFSQQHNSNEKLQNQEYNNKGDIEFSMVKSAKRKIYLVNMDFPMQWCFWLCTLLVSSPSLQ